MKQSLKTNDSTSSSRLAFPGYLTFGYSENVTGTAIKIRKPFSEETQGIIMS